MEGNYVRNPPIEIGFLDCTLEQYIRKVVSVRFSDEEPQGTARIEINQTLIVDLLMMRTTRVEGEVGVVEASTVADKSQSGISRMSPIGT